MVLWGSLQGERAVAGTPLIPVCYSTDQVKGVLTLQGDALSQAVSPPGALSPNSPTSDKDGAGYSQLCHQLAVWPWV